ncbi:hypothetical protein HDU93_009264 [Gonapodya sp. JEL0774]|nr:hypothetical protein HDU93_009264 [Gonapodya sp. JEL0774]
MSSSELENSDVQGLVRADGGAPNPTGRDLRAPSECTAGTSEHPTLAHRDTHRADRQARPLVLLPNPLSARLDALLGSVHDDPSLVPHSRDDTNIDTIVIPILLLSVAAALIGAAVAASFVSPVKKEYVPHCSLRGRNERRGAQHQVASRDETKIRGVNLEYKSSATEQAE